MQGEHFSLHNTVSFMSLDELDSDNTASYTAENPSDQTKQDDLSVTAAERSSKASSLILGPPETTPISYLSHSHSSASFVSLEPVEEPAALRAQQEEAPALQRVGTPVEPQTRLAVTTHRVRLDGDLWARVVDECPDLLKQEFTSDVCDATALPRTSMQRLVFTAGSLIADFQLSHGGLAKKELNRQLANSPFTRTWALYERVAETRETSPTRATPPAALRASEGFASLEPVEEPAALRAQQEEASALQRVGTPVEPQTRLAVTTHRVRLDGDLWARVVDECPDLLKQEFTSDVCDATALPRTSMQRLVFTAGSLIADFQLSHGGLAKKELNRQLANSPFTRTWALYERVAETRETSPTRATPPAALRASESFASLEPVEEPAALRAQQEEALAAVPMTAFEEEAPALQRVGTPVEPQTRLAVTTHRVRLDGDLWARVVDECPDLLKQEFTSDVCDATALPRTSMQRLVFTAGSLIADFQLSHGGLAKKELNRQLANSPFTRTWALYERVAETRETSPTRATPPAALRASEGFASLEPVEEPAALRAQQEEAPALQRVGTPVEPQTRLAVTTHRVRLDGDLWARVVDECPDLLKQEFTSDVCDATALPRTSMQRLVFTAGSLIADFQLSHGGLAKKELNRQLANSPFTRTWALYERVAETRETSPTRATPPAALRASEGFASLEPVEEPAALRAQQEEAPALQRVGTPVEPQTRLAVTTHRVRLDGDLWARVVDECPDLLKQEFTSDVCDATALPRTSMQRLVLTAGSLIADFQLSHGGLAKKELNRQLANSPFTRTWALYERVAETRETSPTRVTPPAALRASESFASLEPVEEPAALRAQQEEAPALQRVGTPVEPQTRLAVTTHRVRLDGDLWARVVDECPDLLKQEFTSDVCDATALPRTSMQRLVLTAGSLIAYFQLSHGGLAKKELNRQLANSPFTRTWALYERVAETRETSPTRVTPPAALRASESFASLEPVEEPAALRAQQEEEPVAVPMTAFEKEAPALQRVGTPVEPQTRLAVTTHQVRLDGDLWARVVDECPDLLKQEFTSDVCDATALPRTSMQRLVLTAGSLIAYFQLSHGGLAKKELNRQLANSPFTRTWALYERVAETRETSPTRATPPAALRASESFASLEPVEEPAALRAQQEEEPVAVPMTAFEKEAPALQRVGTPVEPQTRLAVTTHQVRLDGDLWARVVDECPDLLKQEFTSDVCDATALPRTSMQRLVLTAGSLIAYFQLSHGGLAKKELNRQLANSPFTRTWALYERVAETRETSPTRVTPPAALRASESFASLEPVEEPAALRAQQEEEPVAVPMTAFEKEAPALQRVGTPVEPQTRLAVTTHQVRLDGDLWARVVDECPDLLKQEFTSDVCDATALPRTSMQRLVFTAGSLIADFQLSHGGLAKKELNRQLANSPFTRTWALYERVAETRETSPTRATPPAALRASEGFASLEPVEEPAALRAQQEEAPALQRVGTPVEPQTRLAVTTHRVRLDGDLWARVVDECPDLLKQEFTSDVCDATALPRTSMQRLVFTAGSLIADFQLSHGGLAKKELNRQLANSPFTRTWALYERVAETRETSPTRATPPAALRASEGFASLEPVEEPAALRAQQEEAPALQRVGTPVEPRGGHFEGTPPVATRSVTPPAALRASESFASLEPVEESAALRAQQEEEPVAVPMTAFEKEAPALQRVGTPVEPQTRLAVTTHQVRLDGDLWARVVDECPDLLKQEFTSDVCDATALPRTSMQRLVLTAGSLIAYFQLSHGGLAKKELNRQLANSPFTRTWALYERVAETRETSPTRVTPPAALRASESFASLEPVEEPAALRAQQEEEPVAVPMTAFEKEAPALQRVGTPVEPQTRLAVTTHQVRLDGDLWARVVDECPDLLKQEFTSDVCDATALPRTSMQRLVFTAGSLIADFQLSHGGLAKKELNRQLANSPFTRTWALYERVAETRETSPTRATPPAALRASEGFASLEPVEEPAALRAQQEEAPALQRVGTPVEPQTRLAVTTHRVRLDGDLWARVVDECPDLLKQEFTSDVCDATALPRTSMQRLVFTAGSLIADFQLSHGGLAKKELNRQLANSPFTRTWALYERVAETRETSPTRATPPAALRASEGFASLEPVEEPAALRAQQEEAPALQRVGTPVEPQTRLAVTTHRVRLDGDLWARVVDECPDLLKQEFTSDVCDATALPRTSMQRLVLTAGSLIADFQLSHGGLAKKELNRQLANSPFTRTWALYERVAETRETSPTRVTPPAALRASESFASLEPVEEPAALRAQQEEAPALQRVGTPVEPQTRLAVTTHRVRLDGDLWARVVDECPDLLKQEFTSDVCDATALPRTSMQRLVFTAGSLIADFQLSHGGLAKKELNRQLANSPFTRTWALYERVAETRETSPTRATPPAALRTSESFASLEPVEEPAALRAQQEEASALQRVGTPVEEPAALRAQQEEAPALQRVGTPVEPQTRLAVTTHRVRLDGDLWARVVDECPDLLKQEFTSDVCDATALPRTSMQRLVLTAGSLIAYFQLSHGGLAKKELNRQLANSPFTRTWALYERVAETRETSPTRVTPPAALRASESFASLEPVEEPAALRAQQEEEPVAVPMTAFEKEAPALQRVGTPVEPQTRLAVTTHQVRLDGDLWARVVDECPDLLKQEFTSDVCDATALPRTSMQRLVLTAGSLIAYFQLSHGGLAKKELNRQLANSPFTRTWALYERVAETRETSPTRATPPAALRASESFASLEPVEEPAALRAQQEEAPALQRVGTPVEPRGGHFEGTPPVATRSVTPPAALRASESFASLEPVEESAALRAQQEEEPVAVPMTAFEEEAPALQRVGTPVEPQTRLAVTTHQVRLDGDLWARVVDECPDLLKQEFTSDVCDATALPRTSMQRLVFTAGSLIADFQLSHGGLAKKELNRQLANSPFTRTWALYERVAETRETSPTRATPPAALRASESFASLEPVEESAALRAQQEEEPVAVPMTAFEEEAPALQRVGTPVEPQTRLAVTTHRVRLDGDLWARVVDECPDLLKQEFTSDVCDATALPRTSMQRLVFTAGSLIADFQLSHGGLAKKELNRQLANSPFTRTWALYERVAETRETSPTRATPPAALRASESFASLEPVEEPAALRAQQEEALAAVPMTAFEEEAPALQRVGTPVEPQTRLAVTTHQVRLDGDLWARVVDECPDLLKQEFTSDVCDATALPRTSMQRLVFTAGSLIAYFQLSHGGLAKKELNRQLANSPFTRTWALYERVAETRETSPTRATPPAALRASESFASLEPVEEPAALRAQQEEAPALQRVGTPVEPRGGHFEGTPPVATRSVTPPAALRASESFASLEPVEESAALRAQQEEEPVAVPMTAFEEEAPALQRVGTPVEPQTRLAVTTHRVRLDGDLWARVVDECPDLLKQEFTSDVCDATALPRTSMQRLVFTAGSLIADFQLSHGGLAKKELNRQLANSPFTRTWALYERVAETRETSPTRVTPPAALRASESFASLEPVEESAALRAQQEEEPVAVPMTAFEKEAPALQRVGTPVEPQTRLAVTTHQVRLDGDLWARVVDECPDLLKQEFTSDVCDATALPRTSMQRLVLTAGSLIADFQLSHGGLAKKELNRQLANSPFTRTWALYERVAETRETSPTRVTPPAALRASESFASLEPVEEPAALRAQQEEALAAVPMTAFEEEAPALQRVGTPVEPQTRLAVTTHQVRLDGDLWARVVDECPDLLKQEFTSDVCDATALPRTSMQRLVLTAGSLIAYFQLSHGGLAKKELNRQLANSPFTRTWALYERVAETRETSPTRATPPAALRASESFASLEPVEEPAALRAQQEEAPALQRVGTPVEPRGGHDTPGPSGR
ncbi:hypothetical_protein_-_conserved [Leishmania major strain Friedlin]|nr:hypothetical_protein_-_conserved [Leishmania major strain Friedlin]